MKLNKKFGSPSGFSRSLARITAASVIVTCAVALAAAGAGDLEVVESRYNTIIIHERGPYISMRFGYNTRLYTESVFNTQDRLELPVEYTQKMMVGFAYTDEFTNVLEIGSGGGRFASYMSLMLQDDVQVITVELDDEVIRLAQEYFELSERHNLKIEISDGRLHLLRNVDRHNLIFVDAYRGPFVPFHLLTQEFYRLASDRLVDDGVLVQNIEPSTMLFDSAISTISSVFDNVDIYPAGGNVVVVAYDGDEKSFDALMEGAHLMDRQYGLRYNLATMVAERRIVDPNQVTADPLTDDFAPVEYLRSIERHNRRYEDISK